MVKAGDLTRAVSVAEAYAPGPGVHDSPSNILVFAPIGNAGTLRFKVASLQCYKTYSCYLYFGSYEPGPGI